MDGHALELVNKTRTRLWHPEVLTNYINADIHMGISGYFHVQLIDAVTGVIKQDLQFKNLLTNACLNGIGDDTFNTGIGQNGFTHLAVGLGNSLPNVTNVALDAQLVRSNNDGGIADVLGSNSNPEYGYVRRTRLFTQSQANGDLKELGFFNSNAGGVLLNRALFRDSAGNPTTVTKTSQDILLVIYEWRLSAPLNDQTGTLLYLNNTQSSDWILRPQGVNLQTHWVDVTLDIGNWTNFTLNRLAYFSRDTFFNTRTGENTPSTIDGAISIVTRATYITNTFYSDVTYNLSPVQGNFPENISLFVFTPWPTNTNQRRYLYQMLFTPPLIKDDVKLIRFTMRYSWQRE